LCVVVWREVLYWGRQPPSLLVCLCVVVWCVGVGVGQTASLYVRVFVCGSVGERCCAGPGSLPLCRCVFVCGSVGERCCTGPGSLHLCRCVFVCDSVGERCCTGPGSLHLCRCVFVCGSVARGVVLGQAASLFVGVFVCGSVVRGCGFLREVPPIIIVCIGVCGTTHTDTHRHARMYTRTHTRTRSHNHTHTHAHTQGLSQQRLGPHDPPASSGGWSPWGGPQQQAPVGFSLFHNP